MVWNFDCKWKGNIFVQGEGSCVLAKHLPSPLNTVHSALSP